MNPKPAPGSLVYECGDVIIPPNEEVVSAASVKWTTLSRKAPQTYSPLNSYSPFSMMGKCFWNLFICRCCKLRLLFRCLRLSCPFFTSTVTQTDFYFFRFPSCLRPSVLNKMAACSQAGVFCRCSVYPAHTLTPGPPWLAWRANAREKDSPFTEHGNGCVL